MCVGVPIYYIHMYVKTGMESNASENKQGDKQFSNKKYYIKHLFKSVLFRNLIFLVLFPLQQKFFFMQ